MKYKEINKKMKKNKMLDTEQTTHWICQFYFFSLLSVAVGILIFIWHWFVIDFCLFGTTARAQVFVL